MKVLEQAASFAENHVETALVTVIATQGSTPRHPGTHMLVSSDGATSGTIGGGRVELEVVLAAQEVASGLETLRVKHNLVQDLAMCCGGSMEFLIQPLGACLLVLEEALYSREARQVCSLRTNLSTGHKRCSPALEESSDNIFVEMIRPAPRLVLFGCGHLAAALGPLANMLEFEVILCDDNETGALDTPEVHRQAWASRVVSSFSFRDVEKTIGPVGSGDYVLVLTRDHAIDQALVEATLPRVDDFEYLGLIGSLGKVGRFRKRILAKRLVSESQWTKLHAPIGLDIAAETPQEIAVSIMAELVAIKNRTCAA